MHAEITIPFQALSTFALILARVLGTFIYIPMPGRDAGPPMARVAIAFAVALMVAPSCPPFLSQEPTPAVFLVSAGSELALGLTIGLMVSFITEAFAVGAHILALQAGYAYASVVDPTTQADSDVLQVMAQLVGGLLFYSAGLDRLAIKTFVFSFRTYAPGQFLVTGDMVRNMTTLSSNIFATGLRLALPAVALLLVTELSLALLGRINQQLHLGANSTSIKMMLTLLILVSILRIMPQLFESLAGQAFEMLRAMFWGTRPL